MKLLFMGPPGSGKGTQTRLLSEKYDLPMLSTGDLLRQKSKADTPEGREIAAIMKSGGYISDEKVIGLVKAWTDINPDGYLLDGFPRTVAQLESMWSSGIRFDSMILLRVERVILVERLTGRLTHLPSGRIYHKIENPPKVEGLDDVTQEPLVQREDDTIEAVQKRLTIYDDLTKPLIELIQTSQQKYNYNCLEVDGEMSPDIVFTQIQQHLDLID